MWFQPQAGAVSGATAVGAAIGAGSKVGATDGAVDGATAISRGVGSGMGADFGAANVAGLAFTGFSGMTTSGIFSTTGVGVDNSTMRVVKAVVSIDFLMPNWPLADVMIAKCAIKTITKSVANSASQCLV